MTERSEFKNLELRVRNLGPIARADIDLRPMTVFVGPSNTGKSYLAILNYALHSFFNGRVAYQGFGSDAVHDTIFSFSRLHDYGQAFSDESAQHFAEWLRRTTSQVRKSSSQEDHVASLPEYAATAVLPILRSVSEFADSLDEEIARDFGVESTGSLVRNRVKSGASVVVNRPLMSGTSVEGSFNYRFTVRGGRRELSNSMPHTVPLCFARDESDPLYEVVSQYTSLFGSQPRHHIAGRLNFAMAILARLAEVIGFQIFNPLCHRAHYLPADRTGIMHSHRVVVGSIVRQASRAGFQRDMPLATLSGVLSDFLDQLIALDDSLEGNLDRSIARHIERDILQGKVRMERSSMVGYPEFFYRPTGWTDDLRLMNTSSMVSELAPVVLYLRHVVSPGEVLIIEEPESHLHPAMQVELIRHLAGAVRAGVRIILTTHSEWVLDELANLVYVYDLPEPRRGGIRGGDYALNPDDVGVWLFEPKIRPRGSVVREIPFSAEYGGYASDFNEVAMGTYNDFAGISNRIEYGEGE